MHNNVTFDKLREVLVGKPVYDIDVSEISAATMTRKDIAEYLDKVIQSNITISEETLSSVEKV